MTFKLPVHEDDLKQAQDDFEKSEFHKFLHQWLVEDQPEFVQSVMGQALAGNPAQLVGIFYGEGSNGKSMFTKYIESAFGKFHTTIDNQNFISSKNPPHSEGLRDLAHVMAAQVNELKDTSDELDSGILKAISGDDSIRVRGMRENSYLVHPLAFVFFLTNRLPKITDASKGLTRRIRLVKFEQEFDDNLITPDEFKRIVSSETHYTIHWLIEGLRMFYSNGNRVCGFEKDSKVSRDTTEFMGMEDAISKYFNEWFIFTHDECDYVEIRAICDMFKKSDLKIRFTSKESDLTKELDNRRLPIYKSDRHPNRVHGYKINTMNLPASMEANVDSIKEKYPNAFSKLERNRLNVYAQQRFDSISKAKREEDMDDVDPISAKLRRSKS